MCVCVHMYINIYNLLDFPLLIWQTVQRNGKTSIPVKVITIKLG